MKLLLWCLLFLIFIVSRAQEVNKDKSLRLGFNYGKSTQNIFPFNNPNYAYRNDSFSFQFNYLLSQKKKFRYELNIEPTLYLAEYQLLNKFFRNPNNDPNNQSDLLENTNFYELALNIGFIVRYKLSKNISTYTLGSLGPMYSGLDTERLKKGFAFSDIFSLGFSYQISKIVFDIRLAIRHNSNADLARPNGGHNSVGIITGFIYQIK